MSVASYIENISKRYALGNATEHTFRGDLQQLIEELVPEVAATNEPKRIECGAPDYVITRREIPTGYIEAKDISVDLLGKTFKEQYDRYRDALDNLAFTDYLDFSFYQNGQFTDSIRIGEVSGGRIVPLPKNFDGFTARLKEFCSRTTQTIKGSQKLAEMMADKAKILAFTIKAALDSDEISEENSTLRDQMKAFKDILIHDIDSKQFADIYAQTIAYGMFAARLHDKNLDTFTRREAAELIPKTNPFLRKLFQYIAGYDLDTRIDWIVDALADLFRATDIASILKNFGKTRRSQDPIIHFYETFLAEYDPKLRKSRGVFYTPEPVVDFIVRAVDDILKAEFNLPHGLADTKRTTITVDVQGKKQEQEVHKIQILDPATGTGTFLAAVIKHIYKGFENQKGAWPEYVEKHLVPRLNGFELLMASYAMAHLKLDLLLTDTGYTSKKDKRFQIFLTNSLEEYHPDTGTLFASWLSNEANEASHIKRDTPVMVVIGNPPYAISSSNRSVDSDGEKTWIGKLIDDYKKDLNEKKINLDDDYIKFIRFGQNFVEKNGEGILAYITNNSFLGGITHRRMRRNLLESFDQIYVLDLHGNSKQKEASPDGSVDKNVFDITQGVSVNIFVKTGSKKAGELATLYHFDLYGTRAFKYTSLSAGKISTIPFVELSPNAPNYFFVPMGTADETKYKQGLYLKDLFLIHASGVKTDRDSLFIDFDADRLNTRIQLLLSRGYDLKFEQEFNVQDSGSYKITKKIIGRKFSADATTRICYRPFDVRWIYYDPEIVSRPGRDSCLNMLRGQNWGLMCGRQNKSDNTSHYFLTDLMSEMKTAEATIGSYHFPLYVYPDKQQLTLDGRTERTPNLSPEIVSKIATSIDLTFTNEKGSGCDSFAPIDILDYIYAVLHSPNYRQKYKEFLKTDFPRVPYPKNADTFWSLVALGGELREIHLLESPTVNKFITGYPVGGDNVLAAPQFTPNALLDSKSKGEIRLGDVFINRTQYFSNVPEMAWNFYIGGYQPAQKWLKDRKGHKLSYDDIQHYQKIIVALTETDRIMKEIDKINFME